MGLSAAVDAAEGPTVRCKRPGTEYALSFAPIELRDNTRICRYEIEHLRYCFGCAGGPAFEMKLSMRHCTAPMDLKLEWRAPIWTGVRFGDQPAGRLEADGVSFTKCKFHSFDYKFVDFLKFILPGKSESELGYRNGKPILGRGWISFGQPHFRQ